MFMNPALTGGNIDFNNLCYIPSSEPGSYRLLARKQNLFQQELGIIMHCNPTY